MARMWCAGTVSSPRGVREPSALRLAARVGAALDAMGIVYVIGGSVAAAFVGEPRATVDVDVVVKDAPGVVEVLIAAFDDGFLIDPQAVADAVARHSSFNVLDEVTLEKVDVFTIGDGVLDTGQMARRQMIDLGGGLAFWIPSAEDQVLRKLWWYRLGEERSERQWSDVQGILRVQAERLDLPYLRRTARAAGLTELLDRALEAAGRA